ncbi:MAG: portal protein, partial [Planctomycetota bacterium]
MAEKITDQELKAIVNSEVRSAMGELTGELASDRADSMDYYYGEPIGKLYQPNEDRSSVVITTLRDTVEWMMPQLMRMFAQPDKVVEFDPVGSEDEEAAEQETQAINHIFWRTNEGFLILYTWFKDALLQKNGTVKYWIDESEDRDKEEYDGLTDLALTQLMEQDEYEVLEHEVSEVQSMDGSQLHHVVLERKTKTKTIHVEVIPPEEFLISDDAVSLDVQTRRPRFVGHRTDKTASELRVMGFSDEAIEEMMKSGDESDRYDEEHVARYNYSDEQAILTGGTNYSHESQKKASLIEGYLEIDRNGDGYAELLRVYTAGSYIEAEETDCVPFACLTPYINPHKHHGLSQYDMVHDIQEIATQTFRNVLDNMYQTNNQRPIVNENVDLDSLLVSRPGAPIYTETTGPVANDLGSFAPPPMWKEGLTILEYLDQVRKDRTGIGDETMGLDPSTLANANTGVMLEAIEAARGKIELIARIFAETGIKWLFRGIHELARKSYDQELRYELSGKYVQVNPQEWRKRTNLTVNVGTASGSQQRELAALLQIGQTQEKMVQAGGLGVTVLPVHIYQTAKELAENLGMKDGDKYFFNPLMRQDPQIQQWIQAQMPQQGPDPQMQLLQATAQIEGGKLQVASQKNQLEHQARMNELALKREEMAIKGQLESMKTQLGAIQEGAKNQTAAEKIRADADAKEIANLIKGLE